ncbi:MAG: DUF4349 domain-containing protein [Anaerolineae bacterium]
MSRKVLTSILLLVVALGWVACGGAAPAPESAPNEQVVGGAPRQVAATEAVAAGDAAGMSPALENRMIIQRAEISMVIKDTEATATAIRTLALNAGGYIADSNLFRDGEQLRGTLTVRVPGQNLPTFLDQVKGMAVRVLRDSLSGEDVTQEFTDLGSRLRNLEATEVELLALLTEVRQRPGAKTSDILEVYEKLTQIRGEIEQIKGRMQFLSNLTSLATIQVELIPDALDAPVIEEGWRPLVTLRQASARLIRTLQALVEAVIWLIIYVLPVLILMALPFVLLALAIRALRRRTSRTSRTPRPLPPAAESSEKTDS